MHNVDLTDKLWPPLPSRVIFVISDCPTLIFQKTYHYNGLKRPYEIKYILYLLYKFDLLLRHYKALPENQEARDVVDM